MTLWPLPSTFWPWGCLMYSAAHVRPTYQFLLSYEATTIGYWVLSTEYLITSPLSETVTAHAPCHVSSNRGKNSPHFWNPCPKFAYSLYHFQGAKTKIKPCYRRKIVFPLWRVQSLLRMRSITWHVHRRSPKTTCNNFLTPNCLLTVQLLCGYHDD